jgi:hypothetical protein
VADPLPRWRTQVLGPAVEELGRAWAAAAEDELGPLRQVAAAVVNDPGTRRMTHEIDIVGLDAHGAGHACGGDRRGRGWPGGRV